MHFSLNRWRLARHINVTRQLLRSQSALPFDAKIVEDYLAANTPSYRDKLVDCRLIAVDFETTGLDKSDQIISMGFCPIKQRRIRLADSEHFIVNPEKDLNHDSVTVHGLTDDKVNLGLKPAEALGKFLTLTKGAIIVAHYHQVERRFIQNLAQKVLGFSIPLNFVDTLWIEKQRMLRRNHVIAPNALRLFNLRKKYGLPNYHAHNALEDALATAELFLAQTAGTNSDTENLKLQELTLFQYFN